MHFYFNFDPLRCFISLSNIIIICFLVCRLCCATLPCTKETGVSFFRFFFCLFCLVFFCSLFSCFFVRFYFCFVFVLFACWYFFVFVLCYILCVCICFFKTRKKIIIRPFPGQLLITHRTKRVKLVFWSPKFLDSQTLSICVSIHVINKN